MKAIFLCGGVVLAGLMMTSCGSTETTVIKKVPVYKERKVYVTPAKRPPGDARNIDGGGVGGVGVVTE